MTIKRITDRLAYIRRKAFVYFEKYILQNRGNYYGQMGEDVIIYSLLVGFMPIEKVRYIDLGAGHPKWLSNTYLLYKKGAKGWCIDADERHRLSYFLFRRKDIFLKYCIDGDACEQTFYRALNADRSTIDSESHDFLIKHKFRIIKSFNIKTKTLDWVWTCSIHQDIDVLSIDTEGNELSILQSLDFSKLRPKIICVECVDYLTGRNGKDAETINELLLSKDYSLYSNTGVNLIFVDNAFIAARLRISSSTPNV